jgi:hypothetical protein
VLTTPAALAKASGSVFSQNSGSERSPQTSTLVPSVTAKQGLGEALDVDPVHAGERLPEVVGERSVEARERDPVARGREPPGLLGRDERPASRPVRRPRADGSRRAVEDAELLSLSRTISRSAASTFAARGWRIVMSLASARTGYLDASRVRRASIVAPVLEDEFVEECQDFVGDARAT